MMIKTLLLVGVLSSVATTTGVLKLSSALHQRELVKCSDGIVDLKFSSCPVVIEEALNQRQLDRQITKLVKEIEYREKVDDSRHSRDEELLQENRRLAADLKTLQELTDETDCSSSVSIATVRQQLCELNEDC